MPGDNKKREAGSLPLGELVRGLFRGGEVGLADAAGGADPVIGELLEGDTVVLGGVVDIAADLANVFHDGFLSGCDWENDSIIQGPLSCLEFYREDDLRGNPAGSIAPVGRAALGISTLSRP